MSSITPSDELKSPIDLEPARPDLKSDLNISSDKAQEPPQEESSFEEVLDTPEELKTPEEIKSIDKNSSGKLDINFFDLCINYFSFIFSYIDKLFLDINFPYNMCLIIKLKRYSDVENTRRQ